MHFEETYSWKESDKNCISYMEAFVCKEMAVSLLGFSGSVFSKE